MMRRAWVIIFALLVAYGPLVQASTQDIPGGDSAGLPPAVHGASHMPGGGDDLSGTYATKEYADAIAQGLDPKASVVNATTANITLSGEQTIDGILTSTSRILVKNQNTASQNGIYVTAAGAWARSTDADTSAEVTAGMFTFVESGTTQASTGWVLATPNPIVLATTDLLFTQFSSAGAAIIAGAGSSLTGNTLNIGAGTGITVGADTVGISAGGVDATQIAANSVALGTKTTGDYLSGVTSGGGLTKTGTEGASVGITLCAPGLIRKMNVAGTSWDCLPDESNSFGWLNILDFGGTRNDDTFDNGPSLQAMIDAAEALYVATPGSTGAPNMYIPAGAWYFETPVDFKSAALYCEQRTVGTRLFWNGATDATFLTLADTGASGSSGGIYNCQMRDGGTSPEHWIDTTAVSWLDAGWRLWNVAFRGSSSDAILVGRWANAHFEHLRFDCLGGYAIRATPPVTQNLASFSLSQFTYDSGSGGCVTVAPGFILVDQTANASNLGTFVIEKGRIEVHNAWNGLKAIMGMIKIDAGANSRTLRTMISNVDYQDTVGMADDVWHAISGASGSECLVLENVDEDGLSAVLAGHPASHSVNKAPNMVHNCGTIGQIFSQGLIQGSTVTSTNNILEAMVAADTVARLGIQAGGSICWSSGSATLDTCINRISANLLSTSAADDLRSGGRLASTPQAVSCTDSGNGSLGTLSLQPTASVVNLTNSDADGCTVTMSETSALSGAHVMIVIISNAGGTVNFADTAGVSELTGALTLAVTDTLTLVYTNSAWYQLATSNN